MSVRNSVRAFPALLRVGFAEAVAYRAELIVWILGSTMPLIMLALFSTVAADAPLGRFGPARFSAYFLSMFIVRQLTSSWAAWEMNFEIKQGLLSVRLLRPVHPLVAWAAENLAAMPFRALVSVPVAVVLLVAVGPSSLPTSAVVWGVFVASLLGGWLLTYLSNVLIGTLCFFTDSSMKIMDVWLVTFLVASGYLVPVELFPGGLRAVVEVLPFRFQVGFPVELLLSTYPPREALGMLARQWAWVAVLVATQAWLWKKGVARYAAFGG